MTKKRRKKSTQPELPGQPPGLGGHVSFAVEGCGCLQCRYHRRPGSTTSVLRAVGLERLLSGGVVLPYIAASATMSDAVWDALTGGGEGRPPDERGGRSPFDRSERVRESPFERRYEE